MTKDRWYFVGIASLYLAMLALHIVAGSGAQFAAGGVAGVALAAFGLRAI